jgi:hypothetical protein
LGDSVEKASLEDWEIVSKPLDGAGEQEEGCVYPLLNKLKKAGKEIHDKFVALLDKQKDKPASDEPQETEKEVNLKSSSPVAPEGQSLDGVSVEQEKADTAASDARILKAGILAVFAVSVATICAGYL